MSCPFAPLMTALFMIHRHTHTQPFYCPLSGTTHVSRYQKKHYYMPYSGFMMQGKIAKADEPTIRLDATPSRLTVPPPSSTSFLCQMPFLAQSSQFMPAQDRYQVCWIAYPVAYNRPIFYNQSAMSQWSKFSLIVCVCII